MVRGTIDGMSTTGTCVHCGNPIEQLEEFSDDTLYWTHTGIAGRIGGKRCVNRFANGLASTVATPLQTETTSV